MERTEVASTSVAAVGYDPATKTLEIEFQSGRVYQYYDVAAEIYQEMMSAESHGRYFNEQIKDSGYAYRRIR